MYLNSFIPFLRRSVVGNLQKSAVGYLINEMKEYFFVKTIESSFSTHNL